MKRNIILIINLLFSSQKLSFNDKLKLTLVYVLVFFISNLLMFFLMTYNLWLVISVLVGNSVGYYFFSFRDIKMKQYEKLTKSGDGEAPEPEMTTIDNKVLSNMDKSEDNNTKTNSNYKIMK